MWKEWPILSRFRKPFKNRHFATIHDIFLKVAQKRTLFLRQGAQYYFHITKITITGLGN